MNKELSQQLDLIINQVRVVPDSRRYWLIRTEGGSLYDSFLEEGVVAIGHNDISLYAINDILTRFKGNESQTRRHLKTLVEESLSSGKLDSGDKKPNSGLIASQIYRFITEVKKGDIVIIPSIDSFRLSIGIVRETHIAAASESELQASKVPYRKKKKVEWINEVTRDSLDPYFYKLLQAHQAINNIDKYSDYVERNVGNFYVKNGFGNLILNVNTTKEINALELFKLGYYLLDLSDKFIENNDLELDISSVDVKINLNSIGKIQFKSPNAKTVWIAAVLVIAINGGGIKFKQANFEFDMSTDGIIKNIIDYQNNRHDRMMKEELQGILDSLEVQTPDDAVKILKQLSSNKETEK